MKRRVVILLAVTSVFLCIGLFAMLVIDTPANLALGSRIRLFCYGGVIGGEYRSGETLQGPVEVIGYRGDEPYYANFPEIDAWRRSRPPATGGRFAGIGWSTRFAQRDGSGARLAEKCYLIHFIAEYLVGIAGAFMLLALLPYWRLHRRESRRAAGLCIACGYDLRASGERCPECGRAHEPDVITT
jgi:hypothetical protein